ncbi:MAG: serine/threonine protein kinase, partial [Bradymonadia bacterium]
MLGRYRLLRSLARGGMGELYLAEVTGQHGWSKRVALKTVLPHLGADPEFISRFLDEATIAARLSHATIVSVFDAGCERGTWYLAMEYVDGPDLRRVLKALRVRDALMPIPLVLYIAAELAAALDVAHSACDEAGEPLGIVHRDVSPANVLLSRSGEVKLTDFGIAAARVRATRTETGRLRGTFPYISPEQAGGETVDGRSDVYAVGTLLFELLTGTRAFDGDSDVEILARVRRGERPALLDLRPDLPSAVCALV